MKTPILLGTVIFLFLSIIKNNACAQITHKIAGLNVKAYARDIQNSEWQITVNSHRDYINVLSNKVVRNFFEDFKEVKRASWRKTWNGKYVAQFLVDSAKITIYYNPNGSWDYMYKEYNGEYILPALRNMVKNAFKNFEIIAVKEIREAMEMRIIYSIAIKEGNDFKLLKIENYEMEIVTAFTKSSF